MGWEGWLTLGIVALCVGMLARSRHPPDIILLGGLTLLLVAGVLTPRQALAGLANEGMVTVGVLYVVVTGLRETGGVAWLGQTLLGRPRTLRGAQARLMAPAAALSAFLNNTAVVAMFIPAVQDWAKRRQLPVSRLMLPLSYASIAGGTCTLIGTSTNLVVNGLLLDRTDHPGLGLFELAWVGLPVALVVFVVLLVAGDRLLPSRRSALAQFQDAREYTVEMEVEPGSPLVGKSIEAAGLRQLPGMYLVEIDRDGHLLPAVSPQERLRGGDRLVFAGIVESVADLRRIRGLVPAAGQVFKLSSPRHDRSLVEAVVSGSFPLLGKTIREGRFRSHYNAAVIAVARNGERLHRKVGDIELRAGDTLLLETHSGFADQHRNSRDFLLVSRLDDFRPVRHEKGGLAMAILGGMVAAVASGLASMLEAAMVAAGLMIITGCTSASVARRAVDWQVLLVIAAAFGIGTAMQESGAARFLANGLLGLGGDSPHAALAWVFVTTALLTALVTNNAAAVLMFPVALESAERLGVDFLPFAIAIMVAASASFATPMGYQTNLMVYGPGGYRFSDYLRAGIPITLLVGLVTVVLVPLVWPLR
jgi:di/tricarboxylate transporter